MKLLPRVKTGQTGTTTNAWRPEQPYSRSGGYSVCPSCFNVRRTLSDVASPILVVRTSNQAPSLNPKRPGSPFMLGASYATDRCCCPWGVCCQRDYTCVKQQNYVFRNALLEKGNHAFFLLSCDPAYIPAYRWIFSASQSGPCTIGCRGDHRLQGFRGSAVDDRP
jgi:hypothetical protein